jgi:hypothetical protein
LDSTPPGQLLTTRASPHRNSGLTSHLADSYCTFSFVLRHLSTPPLYATYLRHLSTQSLLASHPPTLSVSSAASAAWRLHTAFYHTSHHRISSHITLRTTFPRTSHFVPSSHRNRTALLIAISLLTVPSSTRFLVSSCLRGEIIRFMLISLHTITQSLRKHNEHSPSP